MRNSSRKEDMTGAILSSLLLVAAISGCDAILPKYFRTGENKIILPVTSISSDVDDAAEILGLDKVTFIAIVAGVSGGLLLLILSVAIFCMIRRCRHRKSPISKFFSDDPLLDEACKPSDEDIDALEEAAGKKTKAKPQKPETYVGEAYVQMPDGPSEEDAPPTADKTDDAKMHDVEV